MQAPRAWKRWRRRLQGWRGDRLRTHALIGIQGVREQKLPPQFGTSQLVSFVVLISNKAPQQSKTLEHIAGVASLRLVHGNDFVADLRVHRFQVGSAERCC